MYIAYDFIEIATLDICVYIDFQLYIDLKVCLWGANIIVIVKSFDLAPVQRKWIATIRDCSNRQVDVKY